jgi:hypothetical protein
LSSSIFADIRMGMVKFSAGLTTIFFVIVTS